MNRYLTFVHKYILECLCVVLAFAAAGSLKGASVESQLRATLTYATPTAEEDGVTAPYMQGLFHLAADENMWYNLRYALIGAVIGLIVAALLSLAAYKVIESRHHADGYS